MTDPRRVLAEGTELQRDMVRRVWPALWEALGGNAPTVPAVPRRLRCPLCAPKENRAAVRRIHLNGTPACEVCLKAVGVIGHPLERVERS